MSLPKQFCIPPDMTILTQESFCAKVGIVLAKGIQLNNATAASYGGSEVKRVASPGDVRTGNALYDSVAGFYIEEYIPYTSEQLIRAAKATRDKNKQAPLTVTVSAGEVMFDFDKESQDNINATIDEWVAIDAAAGGTGSIAWTLADNTEIQVTLADLQAVKQAGVLRGLAEHMAYNAVKAGAS